MSRKKILISELLTLFLFSMVATHAWGVVGTGEVIVADHEGKPIRGAAVTLNIKGQQPITKKTNREGSVTFEAEEGTYEVEISIDNIRAWAELSIPGMVQVTFPRPGAFPPIMTGSRVEITPELESLEDIRLTDMRERLEQTLTDSSGNVLFSNVTTIRADREALQQRNAEIANGLNFTAWSVEGNMSLGSYGEFNHAERSSKEPEKESITFPDTKGRPTRKFFYPSVLVMVGRANAELELRVLSLLSPFSHSKYEGDGVIVGAGLNALFYLCQDCGWFTSGTYRYEQILETDMDIRPPFPIGAGGIIVRDDFELEYKSHMVQAIIGRDFAHFAPYVGVRGRWRDITLTGDLEGNFPNVLPGLNGIVLLVFTQEFTENDVETVVGFGFRYRHVVAGAEASFEKNNSRGKFRIGFGF